VEQEHLTRNRWAITPRAILLAIAILFASILASDAPPGPTVHAQAQTQSQDGGLARSSTFSEARLGARCLPCHDKIVTSFALNTHGKTKNSLVTERAMACESCHGNSDQHRVSLAAADTVNPAKLTSAKADESCLACHSRDLRRNDWHAGKHDRSDMSCLSCHSMHNAKSPERMLARQTVEDTCLRCHNEERKALFQRSTHLFRTESNHMKVSCTSCHNPHGGEGRKMVVADTTNGLCYQCHAERRGPFLWEHAPVQENCLACHSPHGSNNAKLLRARSAQLCQQCHLNLIVRHQAVASFDVFTLDRGCVNCHNQIHGSNDPAGRQFTR